MVGAGRGWLLACVVTDGGGVRHGSESWGSEEHGLAAGKRAGGPPNLDMGLERRLDTFVREAVGERLLRSAHDYAEGGIAIALAESCLLGDIGATVGIDELRPDEGLNPRSAGILFGESQSRFLISFATEALVRLHELAGRHSVPLRDLGSVGGGRLRVTACIDVSLADVRRAHEGALIERE